MNNTQRGPEHAAQALAEVIPTITYKDGWSISLDYIQRPTEHYAGSEGLTLRIHAIVPNSVRPGETTYVEHWMHVPPTSWMHDEWVRWILDMILQVETHEALEFYRVNGLAPYFPSHGPGKNPYAINLTDAEITRRRERDTA
jgi:hypothetical protein